MRSSLRDPTGVVFPAVRDYLAPEAMAERRRRLLDMASEVVPDAVSETALKGMMGEVPQLDVQRLQGGLEDAKASLLTDSNRLAVAIVESNAIDEAEGSYALFVREKLDDRVEDELHDALREAIVDARIQSAGPRSRRDRRDHARPVSALDDRDGARGARDARSPEHDDAP